MNPINARSRTPAMNPRMAGQLAAPLQIFNSHGFLLLVSDLPSGRAQLAKGDYRGLHVGA
jgi:hypothetical protein